MCLGRSQRERRKIVLRVRIPGHVSGPVRIRRLSQYTLCLVFFSLSRARLAPGTCQTSSLTTAVGFRNFPDGAYPVSGILFLFRPHY